ncbi:hypothetical protein BFJ69_g11758 [Fusarium oxysporum]|uniref:Xylanolytic transcriptional activator regulatory domain-containing protein n=1 Tax=Fusarium oxysporum TaxID=5507 RepID=A0A420MR37_FUSOX|nr:hypothetical protein BFJ69_g11758 [Fusarium oxysporum]
MQVFTTKMESRRTVILPDMFKGFVVETPSMNPNYETVKPISERWLAEKCSFSPRMKKRVEFCDFAVFISIAAPDAPFDKLKTMCDWGNWVFPFDDMFDEGSLKSDPKRSQVVIDSLMADMLDKTYTKTKSAVVQAHDDIFRRVSQGSTTGKFPQVDLDVDLTNSFSIPSIQEMLDTRRLSSGVTPLYHLIEYAHDIKLPDEVFENPIIQRLELLGADFVLLSNDILSYRKEENDDCPFSMVAACRMTGQSPQEAFDTVGNLLEERYQYWQKAIEQLPSWGPEIDANVARYIQGIQNVVQANITWSFRSGRYFGKQAPEIRRTRMIDVMVNPPFLQARQLRSDEGCLDDGFSYSLHNNKDHHDLAILDASAVSQLRNALRLLPAKPQLDALIEAFFSNVNHHYNFIHPPAFIRQYINWSCRTQQRCLQDLQLTTLIFMMCACVTQHLDLDSQTTLGIHLAQPPKDVSKAYHDAGTRLAEAIPAGSYHLINLQWKVLSICWFKGEAKFTEAWHTIGLAVQEAYELGLHKSRHKATHNIEVQIGRRAWRVLYCWNWQLSSILGRPFIMNDIDSEPELPDLKGSAPTPTLHIKLQYQLISSLAKRWQTPQNINSPSKVRDYKKMVEHHVSSFPAVFALSDPDTSKDAEWPWVVTHRYYVQTMAYFMILQPYKSYLLHPSTDLSVPEIQQLRAEAVECSLKTLQIATQWASRVSQGDGQFHLVVLCLFDTAAFLSMSLQRDQVKNFPQRIKVVVAVNEAVTTLKELQAISRGAQSSYGLLCKILRKMDWNATNR